MSQIEEKVDVADKIVQTSNDHYDETEIQWDVSYIHMNEMFVIAIFCC